jgi:TonB family protein
MFRLPRFIVCVCAPAAVATSAGLAGCMDRESAQQAIESMAASGVRPDELPVMLNREPPFRYPQALWASRVQGNVTLRIFIDSTGSVRPESTSVWESSGYPAFDSAAVNGSSELVFRPAKIRGEPISLPILLPVYFRHPESAPLPGDTILRPQRRANP